MNRDDKKGYFEMKAKRAQSNIDGHAQRIQWLEGANKHLWGVEIQLLTAYHKKEYAQSLEDWKSAEAWLSAHSGEQPTTEWLDLKTEKLADLLLGEKLPLDVREAGLVIIHAGQTITKPKLRNMARAFHYGLLEIDPSPIRNRVWEVLSA